VTDVPFLHLSREPTLLTDKLAPNRPKPRKPRLDPDLKHPNAPPEPEVDEWWKSIPVPWKNIPVRISGHGEFKTRTGRVRNVHINRCTPSGLELDVELNTFGLIRRRTFDYDEVVESMFVKFPFPSFLV